MVTDISNIIIKTAMIENPICKPNKSLLHAITHGPISPPTPAKVKRTPRIVLAFSVCMSETAAVSVGKMIERKRPVDGNRKEISFGPYNPAQMQNIPPIVMKRIERK